MSNRTKKLRDGNSMPVFGLGLWAIKPEDTVAATLSAVKSGYRLFDTAALYENEFELGKALLESGLKREEYFVVTKLRPSLQGYESTKKSLRASLQKLGLEYVDLFLIHTPNPGKNVESWRAMCELKREGLTRSIGVSNYNVQHLKCLMEAGLEIPAVNQIEFHPWYQENECFDFCAENDITIMAYCPLARGKMFGDVACPLLDELTKKYNKTRAQILLRWSLQRNLIAIPKSVNSNRIDENIQLNDFELSPDDMKRMNGLDESMHVSVASAVMQKSWESVEQQGSDL